MKLYFEVNGPEMEFHLTLDMALELLLEPRDERLLDTLLERLERLERLELEIFERRLE